MKDIIIAAAALAAIILARIIISFAINTSEPTRN